jgi:uncharacterized protein YbjT (DUF2867 family)
VRRCTKVPGVSEAIVFVVGATGYTGRAVMDELARRGIRGIAHVRPEATSTPPEAWLRAPLSVDRTPWEPAALRARLAELRPSHVFGLLGTTRARARQEGRTAEEAYEAVDYGLTMMAFEAARAAPSRPRLVYLSSVGVREDTSNAYMRARARVERALREGEAPYTIVSPSFITGSDRGESRPMERAAATMSDGLLRLAGVLGAKRLRDRYASLTGRELARAMIDAALDPACEGQTLYGEDLRRRLG